VEQKAPVSVKRNDADDLPTQSETASPPSDIAVTYIITVCVRF